VAIAFVFIILLIAIVLYVTEALPMDLVAILALLSLALAGVITPAEAFLGFGDPVIITLTSFFVISAALFNTGVVEAIGHRLHRPACGRAQMGGEVEGAAAAYFALHPDPPAHQLDETGGDG